MIVAKTIRIICVNINFLSFFEKYNIPTKTMNDFKVILIVNNLDLIKIF